MKRPTLLIAVTALLAGTTAFFVGVRPASADSGIASAKGCPSGAVAIGAKVACHYSFGNTNALGSDGENNTVTLSSIVDNVNSGEDVSGNLLAPLIAADGVLAGYTLSGGATCSHVTSNCTLPPGATITTPNIPFHTATAADYALTSHVLGDQADFKWADTCNTFTTADGCSTSSEDATNSAQVTIAKDNSATVTAINGDPSVTKVFAGSSVSDQATVSPAAGSASSTTPTGNVTFTFFTGSLNCTTGAGAGDTEPLVAGVANSASSGALAAGSYSYQATYNGEAGVYPTSTGVCEPLTVTIVPTGNANFTPGFWKNHKNATTPLLPQTLGPYTVHTFAQAQGILSGMGCGSVGALNCMAGMLLAADLNLAQGGPTCIVTNGTIAMANALLTTYSYNFTTNGLKPYTLSPTDQAKAMALHDALSAYNIDGIPTC